MKLWISDNFQMIAVEPISVLPPLASFDMQKYQKALLPFRDFIRSGTEINSKSVFYVLETKHHFMPDEIIYKLGKIGLKPIPMNFSAKAFEYLKIFSFEEMEENENFFLRISFIQNFRNLPEDNGKGYFSGKRNILNCQIGSEIGFFKVHSDLEVGKNTCVVFVFEPYALDYKMKKFFIRMKNTMKAIFRPVNLDWIEKEMIK